MTRSIILPGQKTLGWPKPNKKLKELPTDDLATILATPWRDDVHFVQYAVCEDVGAYRYNNEIFSAPEFEACRRSGGGIDVIAVAFDVDSPAKKDPTPGAVDLWFEAERDKISRLLESFPGGMVWRTKGGWRGCWYHQRRIVSTDDTATWRRDYLAAVVYLERAFAIVADPACNDWNRLHRVPRGIRNTEAQFGWGEPETRETIGRLEEGKVFDLAKCADQQDRDEARRRFLSAWRLPPSARPKKYSARADEPPTGPVLEGDSVWYRVLAARGRIIDPLGPGKWAVVCPNATAHTTPGNATSTVLYAPGPGEVLGHLYCAHSHCANADFRSLLGVTNEEWRDALRQSVACLPAAPPDDAPAGGVASAEPKDEETTEAAERRVVADLIPDVTGNRPAGIPANVSHLLLHHPVWTGRLVYDSFRHERYWRSVPEFMAQAHAFDRRVLDCDTADIQGWLLRGHGHDRPPVAASIEAVRVGLQNACAKNTFDSLRDHVLQFRGLWDGTPRLDDWLVRYMGADDTPLNRAIGRRWLIACVARALAPGCVADMMPILEGPQEIGKNYMLEIMFGVDFVTIPFGTKIGEKDFDQKAADSWCVHDDELACTQRAGLEQVKSWLTQKTAKFRKAFDRDFSTVPRRFIIVGSTNKRSYLSDEENRRFWPIWLRQLRAKELIADRVQIWSEAVAYYEAGTDYRITKADPLWAALASEHEDRKNFDPWEEKLRAALAAKTLRAPFPMFMALELIGVDATRFGDQRLVMSVAASLRRIGLVVQRSRVEGIRHRFWTWPDGTDGYGQNPGHYERPS